MEIKSQPVTDRYRQGWDEIFRSDSGNPVLILQQDNGRHVGMCPFHAEMKPTFIVTSDGGYYCSTCKVSGTGEELANQVRIRYA